MARYIDADKLKERTTMLGLEQGKVEFAVFLCKYIDTERTADVVPKSEYDAVVSTVDNSTKEFLKLHDEYQEQKAEIERLTKILNSYALQYGTVTDQQKVIDKAKSEVAREIFEEIEKNHHKIPCIDE